GQPDRGRRRRGRRPGARAGARAAVGGAAAARGRARHRRGGGACRRGVRRGGLRAGAGRDPGHPLGGRPMTAAGLAEIVGPASAAGRGVGAFNIIGIEHAEAVIAGAEAAGAPVVLAISQNCVAYHGALEPIARAALAAAAAAAVPVAVHLDHATEEDLVRGAVAVGLGSVMYDASAAPYDQNVRATAEVARWCHGRGGWVAAELGESAGEGGG